MARHLAGVVDAVTSLEGLLRSLTSRGDFLQPKDGVSGVPAASLRSIFLKCWPVFVRYRCSQGDMRNSSGCRASCAAGCNRRSSRAQLPAHERFWDYAAMAGWLGSRVQRAGVAAPARAEVRDLLSSCFVSTFSRYTLLLCVPCFPARATEKLVK